MSMVLIVGALGLGWPLHTLAANCSITTTPNPAIITAGQSVDFSGSVSGRPPATYSWTFDGGAPASSSQQSVTVTYSTPGTFGVTLQGTNSRNDSCTANASVTVNAGGGNNPPVAMDDSYNTPKNESLTVEAPGVLTNDSDPDADPLTASLESSVSHGGLTLNTNGSFTYTPANGYVGQDSFTYRAVDSLAAMSDPATVTIDVVDSGAVSINSTSRNAGSVPASPVPEEPFVTDIGYQILAINDLGMHCGDLDTRISSILPPFNVLHSQVVERGITGLPRIMGEGEVTIEYSAVSNPTDPALAKAPVLGADGSLYRTNFWDIALQAYAPFYPPGILDVFYPPAADNVDIGLPVPDVERLYLEDGQLHASQQAMPGWDSPYLLNTPQVFEEHIGTLPFFTGFPFGYTADVNWFEAAGVPISVFDDFGRMNPYPLMRVQARIGGNVIASVDTVMPISGEAECQACHSAEIGNGAAVADIANPATSIEDPQLGSIPLAASIEWASDINILRLHDQKHGTILEPTFDPQTGRATDPVVCQTCHYTPALDLAQVGPRGPENDTSPGDPSNGRDQVKHKSMSNVMHSHHATVTDQNGVPLFPDMPPALSGGVKRDPVLTQTVLEETCYRCHPGKNTQCMRGAMANGGLVCQDCHGNMAQVGDDFSRGVSPATPGAFELAADFYTNPATPRVPWANEPGCGACHTGSATNNLAGTAGTLVNPTDSHGNADGLRLLQAFRATDAKATPIVPANKMFAEDVVESGAAAGNPKLYRVSTGHGDLFCEACHGSTHAEWPNANPSANDNVTATQIQGHSGTITECTVCHEPTDQSLPLGNNGPHGMHPIADYNGPDQRWNLQHRNYRNQGPGCHSCHGDDLRGTVLSRTATDRLVKCKDSKGSLPECKAGQEFATIPKGTPVGCGFCHQQKR